MLVSVVIPVHNGARFLAEALESVLEQEPAEVIVVDDGSSDGSADIARSFDVTVLRQDNQGVAAARNAGIEVSRGEAIAFLDADDLWLPGKLRAQVDCLHAHPSVGYVLTNLICVLDGVDRPHWLKPELLEHQQAGVVPSTLLVRRETFDAVGPFDPQRRFAEDVDWFARAKDKGVVGRTLPGLFVNKRVHAGNVTRDVQQSHRHLFRALKASIDRQRSRPS